MAAIAKPACPSLLEATRDPDPSVRGYAVKALNEISYGDAEVRKTLEGLIRPAMPHAITIQLIAQYHLSSSNAVQTLIGILNDGSITNRNEAIYLLKEIGPKAQTATPALLKTLKHPDRYLRAKSCATLAAVKGEPTQVVPFLVDALHDPDSFVRANAAEALGLYGAKAKYAIPQLLAMKETTNRLENYCVQKALKQIDPETATKAGVQ
jgi:HEAT repeat protein